MRIIAGKLKGRQIKAVQGTSTRPTGDKLKEAIFHKIGPFFEGGKCLDLFAGSGSLGIEAISRGMDNVIFIDKMSQAVRTIQQNILKLKIEGQCEVYRNDAFRALHILATKKLRFDLILLDPPYEKVNYSKLMEGIDESNIAKDACIIYLEHQPGEMIMFNADRFTLLSEKKVNATTSITILQKCSEISSNDN